MDHDNTKCSTEQKFTDEWVAGTSWITIGPPTVQHYVVDGVFNELNTFRTARELIACIADAMEAHQRTYGTLGILHRDISAGNILITVSTEGRRGILMDWDTSMSKDRLNKNIHRVSTRQFMSSYLARNPSDGTPSLIDDRESALHVLTYMAIKFLRHSKANDRESMCDLLDIFDASSIDPSTELDIGNMRKGLILRGSKLGAEFDLRPINVLIRELCISFAAGYEPEALWGSSEKIRLRRVANTKRNDWVYTTFRKYIEHLPTREDGGSDFVDNMKEIHRAKKRKLEKMAR